MEPDYLQQSEYNLQNLLYAGLFTGAILLVFYYIWSWCSDTERNHDNNNQTRDNGRLSMKPVYAHELESGIVVLQSEDGEYFKILKEYDLNGGANNMYGSLACTRPEPTQPKMNTRQEYHSGNQTIAARQFQDQRPSAPLLFDSESFENLTETSGTVFGEINATQTYGPSASVH